MKKKRNIYLLILASMLIFFAAGTLFQYLYYSSHDKELPVEIFQKRFLMKEHDAQKKVEELSLLIKENKIDSLDYFGIKNQNDIYYYLFKGNNLIYWSDNKIDISGLQISHPNSEKFIELANAYCVEKNTVVDQYTILSVIKIKNKFDITNTYVQNTFARGFDLNEHVEVSNDSSLAGNGKIFNTAGKYLFSLAWGDTPIYNATFQTLSIIFFVVAFLLFCFSLFMVDYGFGARMYRLQHFWIVFAVYTALFALIMNAGYPKIIFSAPLFSPLYYASGTFIKSLGHLLIYSLYFISAISFFCFKIEFFRIAHNKRRSFWFAVTTNAVSIIFFMGFVWVLHDLVYNSVFDLELITIKNVTVYSFLVYLIIYILVGSFTFFYVKNAFSVRPFFNFQKYELLTLSVSVLSFLILAIIGRAYWFYYIVWYFVITSILNYISNRESHFIPFYLITLCLVISTLFIVWSINIDSRAKRHDQFQILADKNSMGEFYDYEILTQQLLKDIDTEINDDKFLAAYIKQYPNISYDRISRYMSKYYFYGYWNKFLLSVQVEPLSSMTSNQIEEQISSNYSKFGLNDFYKRYNNEGTEYLGHFNYIRTDLNDTIVLYVQLQRRERNTGNNYPNIVFDATSNLPSYDLSTARYENDSLVFHTGDYNYESFVAFDKKSQKSSGEIYQNGYSHHIFSYPDNVQVVISEKRLNTPTGFLLFWTYLFTVYLVISFLIFRLWRSQLILRSLNVSFFTSLQNSINLFVVTSMVLIMIVMMLFNFHQSADIQRQEQLTKTHYIQNSIEDYLDNKKPKSTEMDLTPLVMRLSLMYKTDINIYNKSGKLIATSQPFIFNKGIIGKLMNSEAYFNNMDEVTQNESIGSLKYLSAYSAIKTSNNQLFGFVNLPLFVSRETLSESIFNALAVFINIYFVILLFAAAISYVISRRLSRPIREIEGKLKAIKLGKKNEKIVYPYSENDEIAMLINQYNLMVDELAESAERLAESERESAWREMARQVAHEIKNPLTPMKLSIQQARRLFGSDKFDEYFKRMADNLVEQIDALAKIASEFSDFARIPNAHFERINVTDKLKSVVSLFKNNYEDVEINYKGTDAAAYILADGDQLTQVFNNLLKNAIQAIMPTRMGVINVDLKIRDSNVNISIADNGSGISPEIEDKIFTPNLTTKSSGMGLGLSIVKKIITVSKGSISFTTKAGEGTIFYISWPLFYNEE